MRAIDRLYGQQPSMARRRLLKAVLAGTAVGSLPLVSRRSSAASSARVVVVGGGFGGASVAKYLRLWDPSLAVTLVEPNPNHVACIGSNLAVTGAIDLSLLTLGYDSLTARGVNVVQDRAVDADPVARYIVTAGGSRIDYDRLVVAPGIDFDAVPGLDSNLIPHAWKAGPQTELLKQQLFAMPAGGTFVMTIPPAPYRCPPGPYERACLVADWLKTNRPGARVVILDANPAIVAEAHTFQTAFDTIHAGVIDYQPGVQLESVDSAQRIAYTDQGAYQADVLNVIPPHGASQVVAPLVPTGQRWVAVDPLSYESTMVSGIHIIGDAQNSSQPKSGHMANAQAKVCADAILRSLSGLAPDPAPKTASACFSPVTHSTAGWLTAVYAYDAASGTMRVVPESLVESPTISSRNFQRMFDWGANLFTDSFG